MIHLNTSNVNIAIMSNFAISEKCQIEIAGRVSILKCEMVASGIVKNKMLS